MYSLLKALVLVVTVAMSAQVGIASDMPDGAKVFSKKCKMCHAMDKKKVGPAVNAMNSDEEALRSVITHGQKRMPKFGHKLSGEEIDALVVFIQAQKK